MKTSLSTSTTSSEVVLEEDTENPYHVLQTNAAQTLERLRATDIRALNRRLRKAFDIFELGTMSNSIIENVLTEVEALRSRFMWMEDEGCNAESWKQDVTLNDFFALVGVIQDMLTEIGQLRMTMNDLQSEYVKKVEENDARVEEEILRSREQKRASRSNSNTTFSAFAWFTNVFAKAPPPSPPATSPKKLKRITSNESVSSTTKQNRRIASIVETEKSKPIILRHKRSDIDRHGPPSSFPRSSEKYRQHRMASYGGSSSNSSQAKPIPYPTLQISRSGGSSVQRSKSMQAPALEYAAARPASFSFNNGYYTGSTVDFCTE